jgi:hypothetical protein
VICYRRSEKKPTKRRGRLYTYLIEHIDGPNLMVNLGYYAARTIRTIGPADPHPGRIISSTRVVSEIEEGLTGCSPASLPRSVALAQLPWDST